MKNNITFGSLFTGIGGFDLGFEQAGMTCIWQVEYDTSCNFVLNKQWNDVSKFADVRECGKHNLEPVDVICGGFPCQDVSVAGARKGLAGERSGLWSEFARIINELNPKWIVIENVPGLLSSNSGRDFQSIVDQLVELGYCVAWRILDSQYFGVAQRRRRVFIAGCLGNGSAAEILFEREGMRWDIEAQRKTRKVAPTLFASGAGTSRVASAGSESEFCIPTGYGITGFGEYSDCLGTLRASGGDYKGGSEIIVANTFCGSQNRNNPDNETFKIDSLGVRRLTPKECERLQGFPDGWTDGQSDTARYKQLGNAVTVPVAKWIGKQLLNVCSMC